MGSSFFNATTDSCSTDHDAFKRHPDGHFCFFHLASVVARCILDTF